MKIPSFKLDCSAWPNGTLKKPVREHNRVKDAHLSPNRYNHKTCECVGRPLQPIVDNVEPVIRRVAETICDMEPELTKLDTVAGVSLFVMSSILIFSKLQGVLATIQSMLICIQECAHGHCKIGFSYHLTHGHIIYPYYFYF